jgi:hypothetical protein
MSTNEINEAVRTGTLDHRVIEAMFGRVRKLAQKDKGFRHQLENLGPLELFLNANNLPEVMSRRVTASIRATTFRHWLKTTMDMFMMKVDKDGSINGLVEFTPSKYNLKNFGVEDIRWDDLTPAQKDFMKFWDKKTVLGKEAAREEAGNMFRYVGKDKAQKLQLDNADLPRYAAPREIVEQIERVSEWFLNPEKQGIVKNINDAMMRWWKTQTLVTVPAYHSRNVFGNIFLNYLAGVVNPATYIKALNIQRHYTKGAYKKLGGVAADEGGLAIRQGILEGGKIVKRERSGGWAWDKFIEHGGMDNFVQHEIASGRAMTWDDVAGPQIQKFVKGFNILSAEHSHLVKGGRKVQEFLETNARFTNFLHQLEKGKTPFEAMLEVKKYLFDYGDLTGIEKRWLKPWMPFYSWTRKNIPLQLEMMATQPGKLVALDKLAQQISEDEKLTSMKRELLPGWIQRNYNITSRVNPYTGEIDVRPLTNWIPMADLSQVGHPMIAIEMSLNPIAKAALEAKSGKSLFTGRPISEVPGQRQQVFSGPLVDKRLLHVLRGAYRPFAEAEKLWQSYDPDQAGLYRESPTPARAWERMVLGMPKTYSFNLQQLQKRRDFDVNVRKSKIKRMLNMAKKRGDMPTIRHWNDTLKDAIYSKAARHNIV